MHTLGGMATLLIVHHTPSPTTHELLAAVRRGATHDAIEGVDVEVVPALSAGASDVLAADGILLGTPANIGYMSGALKHFFDQVYYPCMDATSGLGFGLWVHGNNDTTGAVAAVTQITGGMGWQLVAEPVELVAPTSTEDLERLEELGATVAATLVA